MSALDRAKNAAQKLMGNAKEGTGKLTGDQTLEDECHRDRAAGNLKDAGENVKDAGEKVKDAFRD
jgi:uncharacterized protein YjbJ (UPF0337 family)